jgi:hypothetical protein
MGKYLAQHPGKRDFRQLTQNCTACYRTKRRSLTFQIQSPVDFLSLHLDLWSHTSSSPSSCLPTSRPETRVSASLLCSTSNSSLLGSQPTTISSWPDSSAASSPPLSCSQGKQSKIRSANENLKSLTFKNFSNVHKTKVSSASSPLSCSQGHQPN